MITTKYSKFRSNYVREYATTIFDFKWAVESISGGTASKDASVKAAVTRQKTFTEIEVNYDNVSDGSGIYSLSVELNDKRR